MVDRSTILIRDLVRLYAKYTDAEIQAALDQLRSGAIFEPLVLLGKQVVPISRRRQDFGRSIKKKTTPRQRLQATIEQLKASTPVRQRLGQIVAAALDRKILSSTGQMRAFLAEVGLPASGSQDRLDMLTKLASYLSQLNDDGILDRIRSLDAQETSALQRWTNIIVRGDKNQR